MKQEIAKVLSKAFDRVQAAARAEKVAYSRLNYSHLGMLRREDSDLPRVVNRWKAARVRAAAAYGRYQGIAAKITAQSKLGAGLANPA